MATTERPQTRAERLGLGNGSHAHKALVEKAQQAKKCLANLLAEGSRDFELMDQFFSEYRSYLLAADHVAEVGR